MVTILMVLSLIVVLVMVVAVAAVAIYNGLVGKRNRVQNAWSQIDVQLKRRHDLIPNLVNSVKGFMAHEREILERVTQARANAIAAGNDVPARAAAENTADGRPSARCSPWPRRTRTLRRTRTCWRSRRSYRRRRTESRSRGSTITTR